MLLRSRANALLSVRRVTEVNAGRETAGIDGELALAPRAKAELAARVQCRDTAWIPKPVKRVYVAKANGKRRPLGIPVIADRCLQALTVNALEPEWEARFEPRAYGFRPGRGCQDAITAIYWTVNGRTPKRLWVLDADLAAAFDRLDHDHILASLGTFPARELIKRWLKAGVVEGGWFTPTERGTPQGGPASPVLLNVALHGMENAAGVRYRPTGSQGLGTEPGCPALIRYADDLAAFCHSREQAEQVKARLAAWLAPRGLAFNEEKTRIVHLADGCDFLGFNVRRYRDKLLIKPSTAAMRRIRERLTAEMLALRGANAEAVIQRLNPIIRGWSAYYRGMVSSRAFAALDSHVWRLVHKWAKYSHPNKSKNWIIARYFGVFNKSRRDRWVFGDKDSGAYLVKFAWTKIVRHQMVKGAASADDPALTDYWTTRQRRTKPPLDRASLRMLTAQHDLQGPPAPRRPRAAEPPRMGTVAQGHPQGGPQTGDRRRPGNRYAGRTRRTPPPTRPLRASTSGRRPRKPTTSACRNALGARPSRVRLTVHARFRGGPAAAMRRAYPTRRPGAADRDGHQFHPRPRLPAPLAESHRTAVQSPCRQRPPARY